MYQQTKFTTYAPYQDTETSSQISPRSGSISIDFYDDAGSTIGVNLSPDVNPIELYIPLDRLMPKPTPEYVAPYIPDRNWEFFYYHTTEITLDRGSLHITLNIEDTSAQFSLVIRLGAFPNITSREFDFTCLVGPSTGAASGTCHVVICNFRLKRNLHLFFFRERLLILLKKLQFTLFVFF